MFAGHRFAAEFGFFGSFTKGQETEVITWVTVTALGASLWLAVFGGLLVISFCLDTSKTLDCSAGGSASMLKVCKSSGTCVFCPASSHIPVGFLDSNMGMWLLVPLQLKPSTQ